MACGSCGKKMTVPEKLKSIYEGWKYLIWPNPEIEKIAKKRADICSNCNWSKMNVCRQCGCYISAKVRSEKEKCPIDKW